MAFYLGRWLRAETPNRVGNMLQFMKDMKVSHSALKLKARGYPIEFELPWSFGIQAIESLFYGAACGKFKQISPQHLKDVEKEILNLDPEGNIVNLTVMGRRLSSSGGTRQDWMVRPHS